MNYCSAMRCNEELFNFELRIMKQVLFSVLSLVAVVSIACSCASCKNATKAAAEPDTVALVGPTFRGDSAYVFAAKQCEFGPRVMNSAAHDRCGEWIMQKFREFGMSVEAQDAELKGWDGTMLRSRNIIARFRPEQTTRILLCAHWDSRPWADNDPDSTNWHRPVMAANDGASGVAVMLEVARAIQSDTTLQIGVDFVCFDAEDWGTPRWADQADDADTWALGAQYWAENLLKAMRHATAYCSTWWVDKAPSSTRRACRSSTLLR